MAARDTLAVVAGLAVGSAFVISFSLLFAPPSSPESTADAIITLDRTVCFGTCPDYSLTIHGNGTVFYVGRSFVEVTGAHSATIPPEDVRGLVESFYDVDYFSLRDEYTSQVTDLPTVTTSISIDGRFKQVVDYYGAPESLKQLEDRIDEVANSSIWVGE